MTAQGKCQKWSFKEVVSYEGVEGLSKVKKKERISNDDLELLSLFFSAAFVKISSLQFYE